MTGPAIWPYALALYGRPGAQAALLELQDAHGQCVPFLIWALWLGTTGRPADPAMLSEGAARARAWDEAATAPLRGLRRRLKSPLAGADAARRERLREGVKALELEAERALLEMLEAASPAPAPDRAADPAGGLAAAVRAWDDAPPAALVERLATLAL